MSEKFESHEINERELGQVAGGAGKNKTFFYCCSTCGATKVIEGYPFPAKTPTCCGAPMELKGYS